MELNTITNVLDLGALHKVGVPTSSCLIQAYKFVKFICRSFHFACGPTHKEATIRDSSLYSEVLGFRPLVPFGGWRIQLLFQLFRIIKSLTIKFSPLLIDFENILLNLLLLSFLKDGIVFF